MSFGVDLAERVVAFVHHRAAIGTQGGHRGDVGAGTTHGQALKRFAHQVEEHHAHRFRAVAEGERAHRGDEHEGELVEEVAAPQGFSRFAPHAQRHADVGRQIEQAFPRRKGGHGAQQPPSREGEEESEEGAAPIVPTEARFAAVVLSAATGATAAA